MLEKKIIIRLFNSYVFLKLEASQRQKIFNLANIVRYLFLLNKPAIIYGKEIFNVKSVLI